MKIGVEWKFKKIFDILRRRIGYLLKGFYLEGKIKVLLNRDLKRGYIFKGETSCNNMGKSL